MTTVHPSHGQHPATNLLSVEIGADMSKTSLYPPPFRQPLGMSEGAYLTDQRRLFRVLLVIGDEAGQSAGEPVLSQRHGQARELGWNGLAR